MHWQARSGSVDRVAAVFQLLPGAANLPLQSDVPVMYDNRPLLRIPKSF